jgi:hypothetical protein
MTNTKKFEWTEETSAKLQNLYVAEKKTLAELAKVFGRTEASIRAKLSNLGVYEKPVKDATKKDGETKSSAKAEIVVNLAILLGLKMEDLASLEKATKNDLQNLQDAVVRSAHHHDNKTK